MVPPTKEISVPFFHVFYPNIIPSIEAKFLLEVLAVVAVPRPDCDSVSQGDSFGFLLRSC